jgi:hypothetical protein
MQSRKTSVSKNKTHKMRKTHNLSSQSTQKFEQEIVIKFLSILNTVKIYHWKTHSYPAHKATDDLYSDINDNIDKFIEVLLGKLGNRIDLSKVKSIPICDFNSNGQIKNEVIKFKGYLVGLNKNKVMNISSNSDLYNIRDELLADLNKFLYLLTLK